MKIQPISHLATLVSIIRVSSRFLERKASFSDIFPTWSAVLRPCRLFIIHLRSFRGTRRCVCANVCLGGYFRECGWSWRRLMKCPRVYTTTRINVCECFVTPSPPPGPPPMACALHWGLRPPPGNPTRSPFRPIRAQAEGVLAKLNSLLVTLCR